VLGTDGSTDMMIASTSRSICSCRLPGTVAMVKSPGKMCFLMVDSLRLIVLIFFPWLHSSFKYASTCSSVHLVCICSIGS
jgi:hypothetical protein